MDAIKTYAVGNGEITLSDHDAEELRIILQTEHLRKVIESLVKEYADDLNFNSEASRNNFISDLVEFNDDLISYDSIYHAETLTENIFLKAEAYGIVK